ncbi:MAG: hypothetical protein PHT33_02490 [bacterium]|nr:hypothetical protein [bacterium]
MSFSVCNGWPRQGRIALIGVIFLVLLRLGLLWWQGSLTGNDMPADDAVLLIMFLFPAAMAVILAIIACQAVIAGQEIRDRRQATAVFRAGFLPGLVSALLLGVLAPALFAWGVDYLGEGLTPLVIWALLALCVTSLFYSGAFLNRLLFGSNLMTFLLALPLLLLETISLTAVLSVLLLAALPALVLLLPWLIRADGFAMAYNPEMETMILLLPVCLLATASFMIAVRWIWIEMVSRGGYPLRLLAAAFRSRIFWCRLVKSALLTPAAIALVSLAIHGTAILLAGLDYGRAGREARQAGMRMTREEVIPPALPDDRNAARIYEQAFVLCRRVKERYDVQYKKPEKQATLWEKSQAFLFNWKEVDKLKLADRLLGDPDIKRIVALTERAVAMPDCRFDLNYNDLNSLTAFEPHDRLRSLFWIINDYGKALRIRGHQREALQIIRLQFLLPEALLGEPFMLSHLKMDHMDRMASERIHELLEGKNGDIAPEDYAVLVYELGRKIAAREASLGRVVEGETTLFLLPVYLDPPPDFGITGMTDDGCDDKPWRMWTVIKYLSRPLLLGSAACQIRYTAAILKPIRQSYFRGHARLQQAEKKLERDFPFLQEWRAGYSNFYVGAASDTAKLQVTRQALALRCYRLRYGAYPMQLKQLVPACLPELPLDPFTGREYVYRRQKRGFVLYSLGEDLKDDGGQDEPTKPGRLPPDIVWKLNR